MSPSGLQRSPSGLQPARSVALTCSTLVGGGDGESHVPLVCKLLHVEVVRPGGQSCSPCTAPWLSAFLCRADRWSQEDMLTLLECMKNNLPSNDGSKFKTTESHLDWEKVAFKDFSGEMCKMKWMEISNEVRAAAAAGVLMAPGCPEGCELPQPDCLRDGLVAVL